ncbi:MAG: lytic transglycosylase domain-containing protein [Sulfurospirillaceae bacterium]|nr:lytic transglycosylase domain-containing protein [Sulfurospirillaceae bacterium]MDD2826601.1 lytic transglycosylase domain-containing protein [Sulfurospirillaceae bacterium]
MFVFITTLTSFAGEPLNFTFFEDKPQCLAKDFYIYSYLEQNTTTPEEAKELFGMVYMMNIRFFNLFAQKMDNEDFKKISKCLKMDITALLKEDKECLSIGISISKATSLPKSQLKILAEKMRFNPSFSRLLAIMSHEDVFNTLLNEDAHTFLTLFNGSITAYKEANLNFPIPKNKINALSESVKFNAFVNNVIQNDKLIPVQKSLLHVNPSLHVKPKALFFLGLNALKYNDKKQAMHFFALSFERTTKRDEKDKALFWQYLVSQDQHYLQTMMESYDINIYTLYAHEALNIPVKNIVSPILEGEHPTFDVSDPFAWPKEMDKIVKMSPDEIVTEANSFKYANTLPQYSYLMERVMRYQTNFYPIPYAEFLSDYSTQRKALILAIARQESRFLPSVVSTSYALGMMQFMPFVARDIAKKEHLENFTLEAMFNPHIAYLFANIHLDFLERNLMHPVFIAYAYNGGIGFTKRLLQSGTFKKGPYEPFLSMEIMSNEESREYGKKVLANYVVYMTLLGEEVSIKNLFEMLLIPSQSDHFRN